MTAAGEKLWISSKRFSALRLIEGAAMTFVCWAIARVTDCLCQLAKVWLAQATDRNRCIADMQP